MDKPVRRTAPPELIAELKALLGERLSTSGAVCEQHGHDESYHETALPDAVAFAQSTEEVSAIVKACAKRRVPVVAFGTGTSLEGHVAALEGGVCIDLMGMNKIVAVRPEDLDVTVQAGVTRKQLNEFLRDQGLFFPVDPGADASLGGMAATRASGTNAVRYGTMKEAVLSATVVLPDGQIITTASRAKKSAAGYDLTHLFVGCEGTLGIITELTLRLYGIPEAISAAVCSFPSVEAAVNTVILIIQSGIPVARMELLDETSVMAVNRFAKLDLLEKPTLFFEFHGSQQGVAEQAETVGAIAAEEGGERFTWAAKTEDRSKMWQARHDAYYAALALKPGCKGLTTDVCVPISRLAEAIGETRADVSQSFLTAAIVGHVGDGNFHTIFLIEPGVEKDLSEAKRLSGRMVERALAMGGTCTGEHGIGTGKMHYLEKEFGPAADLMRTLKRAIDPLNIMNPGKVIRV
ncbi:MAG: FAD-binding protein [Alphaproteobacteria bacterium]|nr:FAD-binding protein [Alphaproteobacteria bacterium]